LSASSISPGSTWNKWDLHVHTPDSFYQNYPGGGEHGWDAFIDDLRNLPPEFKVIGVNDYLLVDGYEKVLRAKRAGRLPNIDLILPVVELRLDKFGGVVRSGKGAKGSSPWSRVNVHVIFDQVDPQLIREQFIPALSSGYKLTPDASGRGVWNSVITRASIEELGRSIIESTPEGKRADFGSPLIEGFNNLNVSAERLRDALQNEALRGKFVVAVGKTEWADVAWNDHTVADKKTVINEASLVFTAAASPGDHAKARAKLIAEGVNAKLLDCSDAHWPSGSDDKDRVGNCFTWIKADRTFAGLLQAIEEFDDRVFVGDVPPKVELVRAHKTKFIKSVSVAKKDGSSLAENWFDVELPLSSDLVAIIGNKGSGKSALSDIVALAGSARNHASFSFLTPTRFRSARGRLAQHFTATLAWHDGTPTSIDLDKDPAPGSVERVKYLPQSYLETLCNELGDKGSETFDAELRKIIYSHVPEEDRLRKPSMDDLLAFKVAELNAAQVALRQDVSKVNREILAAERRAAPEFRKALEEQLDAKRAELAALEAARPQAVDDPNASPEALEESKQAAARIEELEAAVEVIDKASAALREQKASSLRKEAVARRISQALANQRRQHTTFEAELASLVKELGEPLAIDSIYRLWLDSAPVDAMAAAAARSAAEIDATLQSDEPDGVIKRRAAAAAAIGQAKGMLGERQRLFVVYKEALVAWERRKAEVSGSADKVGSITWILAEIESLAALSEQLAGLRELRVGFARSIHAKIHSMVDEYARLYGPVQAFVDAARQMDMPLPLEFHVRVEEDGFEDQFFNRLNRQVRGSFSGIEESAQLLRGMLGEIDFGSADEAVGFASRVDHMLHWVQREGQADREARLADQLRKGVDSADMLDFVFGLHYLSPRYALTYAGQEIGQLSPGERGLLLLVFYLLVDKDDIPIVIDQPEENLDNQTIFNILVKCIKKAKERRQVIMVTHNPNLAVVCDAEQIVHASCDKTGSAFRYVAGAIEDPAIRSKVVDILEGTEPAFRNRQSKYRLR
jgi:ABC-type lipoprotein export system ATPase subunit